MNIGVIVTVYNIEMYIEKCLNSILNQKYRQLEVVIVDDGSTDNSGVICDGIADKDGRVTVIHQENQGPIKARLAGVRNVQADYVSFVDGDDWLDLNLYSNLLERHLLETVDVISFGLIIYHSEKDWKQSGDGFDEGVYERQQIADELIPTIFWDIENGTYGINPSLCGKVFKRSMLENYLSEAGSCDFHYGEDAAVLYPMLCNTKSISIIKSSYYYHRQRKNNEVSGYFADEEYYRKLYILYDYLKRKFLDTPYRDSLVKQLDYFYMYSVGFGKLKYCDLAFEELFLFPFKKVERNKKLILYGAGRVGHTFYRQLKRSDYCQIVGWVDRNYTIYMDDRIQPVETIKDAEYDFIVIAIESPITSENVKNYLKNMGIHERKMITIQ